MLWTIFVILLVLWLFRTGQFLYRRAVTFCLCLP
jgi:hypothetical protein